MLSQNHKRSSMETKIIIKLCMIKDLKAFSVLHCTVKNLLEKDVLMFVFLEFK